MHTRKMKIKLDKFKKIAAGAMSVMMLITTAMPVMAEGSFKPYPHNGPYTIEVSNHFNKVTGDNNLVGAEYTLFKTYDMDETGKLVNAKNAEVGKGSLTKEKNSLSFTVNEPGQYKLEQTKRPDGYFLGQGYKDADKKEPLKEVVFDLPLVTKGEISSNQALKIQPKFIKAELPLKFVKQTEDGKPMSNVDFDLYQIKLHANATAEEMAHNGTVIESQKSGEDGKVNFDVLLQEGSYILHEKNLPKGYGERYIAFNVQAKSGKENTAASVDDLEIVSSNAEFDGKTLKNVKEPLGGGPGDKGDKDFPGTPFFKEVKKLNDAEYASKINGTKNDSFSYKASFVMPKNIKNYTKYIAIDEVNDKLSLLSDSVEVKLNGAATNAANVTVDKAAKKLTMTVTDFSKLSANDELSFEFNVKLDGKLVAGESIKNNVVVTYNDGDTTPTGDPTPDKTTDIPEKDRPEIVPNIGTINIIGRDGNDNNVPVPGAEFSIEQKDPTDGTWKGYPTENPIVTDSNGKITIPNLPNGEYRIKNTKAPDGYRKNTEVKTITIDKDNPNQDVTFDFYKSTGFFPSTGTLGLIPYLLVSGMVAGLGYTAMKKRKELN